ncbi:unnamed protein product [Amaranthus hypochondriacus]
MELKRKENIESEEGNSKKKYVKYEEMRKIYTDEKKKDENENKMKKNVKLEKDKKKRTREYKRVIYNIKKHHFCPMTFDCDFLKTTNAVFDVDKSALALSIFRNVTPYCLPPCKENILWGDMTLFQSTLIKVGGAIDVLKQP